MRTKPQQQRQRQQRQRLPRPRQMGRSYFNQRIKMVLLILIIPLICWQYVVADEEAHSPSNQLNIDGGGGGCEDDGYNNGDGDGNGSDVTKTACAFAHYPHKDVSEITGVPYAYGGVANIYDDDADAEDAEDVHDMAIPVMHDRFNDGSALDESKGLQSDNMMRMTQTHATDDGENINNNNNNNNIFHNIDNKPRAMHDKQFVGGGGHQSGVVGVRTMWDQSKRIAVTLSSGHQHSRTKNQRYTLPLHSNDNANGNGHRRLLSLSVDGADEFTMPGVTTEPTTSTLPNFDYASASTATTTAADDVVNADYEEQTTIEPSATEATAPIIEQLPTMPGGGSNTASSLDDDDGLYGQSAVRPDVGFAETGRATASPTEAPKRPAPSQTKASICKSFPERAQLIYEFAIKFKQTAHVSYLTCPRIQGGRSTNCHTMELLKGIQAAYETARALQSEVAGMGGNNNAKRYDDNGTMMMMMTAGVGGVVQSATTRANSSSSSNGSGSFFQPCPGVLIKIVQIDQLINKRERTTNKNNGIGNTKLKPPSGNNNNNNNYNRMQQRKSADDAADGNRSNAKRFGVRGAYANWLENVLHAGIMRQIVVLDLSCGAASRRVLEMASAKSLFTTNSHWLLIEDYTTTATAEQINDDDADAADDDEDDNDSSNNNNNNNNNNNDANINTKGKSQNSVHAVAARAGAERWRLGISVKNISNGNAIATTTTAANGKQQQQQQQQQQENLKAKVRSMKNAKSRTMAGDQEESGNEEDLEIIEKFLQRININIDTELILAKRRRGVVQKMKHMLDDDYDDEDGRGNGGDGSGGGVVADMKETASGLLNMVGAMERVSQDLAKDANKVKSVQQQQQQEQEQQQQDNKALQRKDYYTLYDVWNPGKQYGGKLNITEIGNFTLTHGIRVAASHQTSTTITRRMDMKMARLRCLVVVTKMNRTDSLEEYLTTRSDTHLDSMNRFNFALLSYVREYFNFSFAVSKTSTWGYLKNGKFDGMIGALVRKQADVGGSPIFFRIERARVIDYTAQTWVARPCFIFRHPRSTVKDRVVFLQPFTNNVWILLTICGIVTVLLLWMLATAETENIVKEVAIVGGSGGIAKRPSCGTNRVCRRRESSVIAGKRVKSVGGADVLADCGRFSANASGIATPNHDDGDDDGDDGVSVQYCSCSACGVALPRPTCGALLESLLVYIGSICQQGLSRTSELFSGRCIILISLLFSFTIFQFYSASIVGTLLMEKPKTIRTLKDLVHSKLDVGIEDIVYNRDYFLRTRDPIAMELYAKKVTAVPANSGPTFADSALDNGYATTTTTTAPQTQAEKAKSYRDILHSHETGAHAKTNQVSNWLESELGVRKIRLGNFAFHVDVATAYKIIGDDFTEKEICDLTEIQLFPPQKMMAIVQKGSPLRKMFSYGLRRVTETGLLDYERKIWHSPKPACIKHIRVEDLQVDMQTFTSALLVLIYGSAVSLLTLALEIMHHKLWRHRHSNGTGTGTTNDGSGNGNGDGVPCNSVSTAGGHISSLPDKRLRKKI